MEHIQNEFDQRIKYICIASRQDEQTSHHRSIYIQIILHKAINKKTYFLKAVSGSIHINFIYVHTDTNHFNNIYTMLILEMGCNYAVTTDDVAWNQFVKQGLLNSFSDK